MHIIAFHVTIAKIKKKNVNKDAEPMYAAGV